MTRNVASLMPESKSTDLSQRQHEIHAQDWICDAETGCESQDALSQDSVMAAAGLNGLPHERLCCLDCGRITSNINEGLDLFSLSYSAPSTCSFCAERRSQDGAGQHSGGAPCDVKNRDCLSHSPSLLRHRSEVDVLYESLPSEQVRSWVSSFGSIETVPDSGDFSLHMTDGGGKDPPSSSLPRPSPSPRPIHPPPRYPEYSSLQSRLDSYVGWPQRVVAVSPASLAANGFFYIGSADRVRCFQCGVTLRNWEPEDDPATEHVTWSPACPVALLPPGLDSQTGFRDVQAPPESVEMINGQGCESRNVEQLGVNVAGSDHHTPPHTSHGTHVTTSQVNRTSDNGSNDATPSAASPSNGRAGVVHNSDAPVSRGEETVSTAAGLEPPSVLAVLELGCSRDAVDRVRERRRRLQGTDFPDAISLYMAVMEEGSENQDSMESSQTDTVSNATAAAFNHADEATVSPSPEGNDNETPSSSTEPTANPNPQASPLTSGGATSDRGRQFGFRQCRVCGQGEVTVTFLPCGHLIACSDCAQKSQTCPRCGRTILGTVRTYFA